MTDPSIRHLVLELHDDAIIATIACLDERVLWDKTEHTLVAALATCPACRVVQAARVVVIDADGEGVLS